MALTLRNQTCYGPYGLYISLKWKDNTQRDYETSNKTRFDNHLFKSDVMEPGDFSCTDTARTGLKFNTDPLISQSR